MTPKQIVKQYRLKDTQIYRWRYVSIKYFLKNKRTKKVTNNYPLCKYGFII